MLFQVESSHHCNAPAQIQEIKEAVELPLTHPELYEDIGIKPPKVGAHSEWWEEGGSGLGRRRASSSQRWGRLYARFVCSCLCLVVRQLVMSMKPFKVGGQS